MVKTDALVTPEGSMGLRASDLNLIHNFMNTFNRTMAKTINTGSGFNAVWLYFVIASPAPLTVCLFSLPTSNFLYFVWGNQRKDGTAIGNVTRFNRFYSSG